MPTVDWIYDLCRSIYYYVSPQLSGGFEDLSSGGHLDFSLLLDQLRSTPCLQFANVLALETNEKANSCEPFIEVDDTLNKLKNGNVIQDILDNDDEYLILKGISSKLTRNLLETFENNSEIDIKS